MCVCVYIIYIYIYIYYTYIYNVSILYIISIMWVYIYILYTIYTTIYIFTHMYSKCPQEQTSTRHKNQTGINKPLHRTYSIEHMHNDSLRSCQP